MKVRGAVECEHKVDKSGSKLGDATSGLACGDHLAALYDEQGVPISGGWWHGTVDSWDVRSALVIAVVRGEEGHGQACGVDLQNKANQCLNRRYMEGKCE